MKQPTFRVPLWPLASSTEAVIGDPTIVNNYGCSHPPRSMNIPLRSAERFEALYLVVHVVIFEDGQFSLEMVLKDVYRVNVREAQGLFKLLADAQKRVDKALEAHGPYTQMSALGDTLYKVFAALKVREVVEYRGIGVPDVVRGLMPSDIARYVTVAERIVARRQVKAA